MKAPENKIFHFGSPFDEQLLDELYQGDYQTIEDLLGLSLSNFEADVQCIKDAFEQKNQVLLLKAIHKFKPTFGFLGLPQYQEKCRVFEDFCKAENDLSKTITSYNILMDDIQDAHKMIEKTYLEIKEFNTQNL